MDFTQNLKAFLKDLPLTKMSGHQKFLAMASLRCKGKKGIEVATKDIKKHWRRSVLNKKAGLTQ